MTLNHLRILVVDDEPVLRLTFRLLLQRQGATVHVAGNGEEAMAVLQSTSIDVMLTDRQMPVMDGMALLRSMAAANIRVPSILFATGAESDSPEELRRLQVVEKAFKPIQPAELIRMLSAVAELYVTR